MSLIAVAECVQKDCTIIHGNRLVKGQVNIHSDGNITITCKHTINYSFYSVYNLTDKDSAIKTLWIKKNSFKTPPAKRILAQKNKNVGSVRRGKYELCFLHGLVCPQYDWNVGKGRCF